MKYEDITPAEKARIQLLVHDTEYTRRVRPARVSSTGKEDDALADIMAKLRDMVVASRQSFGEGVASYSLIVSGITEFAQQVGKPSGYTWMAPFEAFPEGKPMKEICEEVWAHEAKYADVPSAGIGDE